MEEDRLRNLQKSKSKFLSQIAANQINHDPHATLEDKMERLIKQAELLASFLLNKYSDIDPSKDQRPAKRGSASKRSRQKKKNRKHASKSKARLRGSFSGRASI